MVLLVSRSCKLCKHWFGWVGATIRCPCQALRRTFGLNQEVLTSVPFSKHGQRQIVGWGSTTTNPQALASFTMQSMSHKLSFLYMEFVDPVFCRPCANQVKAFHKLDRSWRQVTAPRLCFGFQRCSVTSTSCAIFQHGLVGWLPWYARVVTGGVRPTSAAYLKACPEGRRELG